MPVSYDSRQRASGRQMMQVPAPPATATTAAYGQPPRRTPTHSYEREDVLGAAAAAAAHPHGRYHAAAPSHRASASPPSPSSSSVASRRGGSGSGGSVAGGQYLLRGAGGASSVDASTVDIDVVSLDNTPRAFRRVAAGAAVAAAQRGGASSSSAAVVAAPDVAGAPARARFVVRAAAEIFSAKVNLELPFPCRPTYAAFEETCRSAFRLERVLARPEGAPMVAPFEISRIDVLTEGGRWDPVDAAAGADPTAPMAALRNGCQVYVFQKEVPGVHEESTQPLPPAQSPMLAALPELTGVEERIDAVFEEADVGKRDCVDLPELLRLLRTLNVGFPDGVVEEMFIEADADGDTALSRAEFRALCHAHPTLAECLYFRSRDFWEEYRLREELEGSDCLLAHLRSAEHAKKVSFDHTVREVEGVMGKLAEVRQAAAAQRENERLRAEAIEDAEDAAHGAVQGLRDAEAETQLIRDREAALRQVVASGERERAAAQEGLDRHSAELQATLAREKELKQALADVGREAERQRKLAASSAVEVRRIQAKIAKAQHELPPLDEDAGEARERVRECAASWERVEGRRVEAYGRLEEEQGSTEQVLQIQAALEERLGGAREQEAGAKRVLDGVGGACAEQARVRDALEAEYSGALARRQEIERDEAPLLNQELQLKVQKQNICQQETELRMNASGFFKVRQRGTHTHTYAHPHCTYTPTTVVRSVPQRRPAWLGEDVAFLRGERAQQPPAAQPACRQGTRRERRHGGHVGAGVGRRRPPQLNTRLDCQRRDVVRHAGTASVGQAQRNP